MLQIQRFYYYCYQYFQSLLKTAIGGVKEICCSCWLYFWCSSKGRRPLLPVPKHGHLKGGWAWSSSEEHFQQCRGQLMAGRQQPPGSRWAGQWGGNTRLSADSQDMESSTVWSAKAPNSSKALSLCSPQAIYHTCWVLRVFLSKMFWGHGQPFLLTSVCGIKLTQHNPNTAPFCISAFLDIYMWS